METLSEIHAFLQQPQYMYPICAVTVGVFLLLRLPATALYVALMPLVNWAFAGIDTWTIPSALGGGEFHPFQVVTGMVLVVRDFAQREIGNKVLLAMLVGLALATLTGWFQIVLASGAAFLISELIDWLVFTFNKRPLSQRILISSAISAPVDQIAFTYLASLVVPGMFAVGTIIFGIIAKMIGAVIVSYLIARRERAAAASAAGAA